MTHFLDIHTTSPGDLRGIIDNAAAMKSARAGLPKGTKDADQPLANQMVALIFEKPSTRTRIRPPMHKYIHIVLAPCWLRKIELSSSQMSIC